MTLSKEYYESLAMLGMLRPEMNEFEVFEAQGALLRDPRITARLMKAANKGLVPYLADYLRSLSRAERVALRDELNGVIKFSRKAETDSENGVATNSNP